MKKFLKLKKKHSARHYFAVLQATYKSFWSIWIAPTQGYKAGGFTGGRGGRGVKTVSIFRWMIKHTEERSLICESMLRRDYSTDWIEREIVDKYVSTPTPHQLCFMQIYCTVSRAHPSSTIDSSQKIEPKMSTIPISIAFNGFFSKRSFS